ncbi:MAG: glycosyl hydrolase [Mucilaginibacter sp.]|nr:glycosyl hydrolase [Mucilaginibacter sp.]
MKKVLLSILAFTAVNCSLMAQTTKLFDGKTTTGWHSYLKTGPGAWKAVDGALQLDPKAEGQGDLVTDKEYENYELSVTWKIAEGGNSGIIFGIHEDPSFNETYLTGIEMQVLDDQKASDNKKANHLAGSLYDLKAPSSAAKPAGEWNAIKIRKDNGQLTFWMNGTKTVDVKIGGPEWQELINNSKFKTWKSFATYPKGHIALQDHGAVVSFKDITIKEL